MTIDILCHTVGGEHHNYKEEGWKFYFKISYSTGVPRKYMSTMLRVAIFRAGIRSAVQCCKIDCSKRRHSPKNREVR